jgi:hypothetical protein
VKKIKVCKQKLSELKKYENIIKKKTCKKIKSKKKVKPWDKKVCSCVKHMNIPNTLIFTLWDKHETW